VNVVDSCGWLEYLADGANASFFEPALLDEAALLVPAITLFEVTRTVLRQRGPAAAETALGFMIRGKVVDLDAAGLLRAAQASVAHRLAMADALIWQTATDHAAALWTQDADLSRLPGVRFRAKLPPAPPAPPAPA
jgi:predicted nucleic acid-binding protein